MTSIKSALIELSQRRSPEMAAAVAHLQANGTLRADADTSRRDGAPPPAIPEPSETVGTPARSNESGNGDAFCNDAPWWAFACGICAGLLLALLAFVAVVGATS